MDFRLIALVLVPCLGYTSYLLLILGEYYRQKNYAHHIVLPDTALGTIYGPMLPSVKAKEWFNLRILLTWLALGGVLGICYWFRQEIHSFAQFDFFDLIMGIYFTAVLAGVAAGLWPLLIFKYAAKEPSSLTGQVMLTSRLVAHQIFYQMCSYSVTLVGLAIYQPTTFLLGSALVSLSIVWNCWRRIGQTKNA